MNTSLYALTGLGLILAAHQASAVVVYANDFESGQTTDFSGGTIQTAPNGQNFLGAFAQGASTTLTLTGLATHTDVTLTFDLYVVGSMDGDGENGGGPDTFIDSYSGAAAGTLLSANFANYEGGNTQDYPVAGSAPQTGAVSINTLGYTGFPGNTDDSIYSFTATINDTSPTISFTFAGDTSEPADNEFYGIDNVYVATDSVVVTPVPEPMTLALFAGGALAAGLLGRRMAA